jgi:hypothetical protein
MIKTFTTVVTHLFASRGLPVMVRFDMTIEGLFVWNFEFGSLEFV